MTTLESAWGLECNINLDHKETGVSNLNLE